MKSRMYAFIKMPLLIILIVVLFSLFGFIFDIKKIWEWIICNIEAIEIVLSVLASLCTIIGFVIVIAVLFAVKWRKQRVNLFLDQCNAVSDVISRILRVYNDDEMNQEATFNILLSEAEGIIGAEKGVACLNRIFVDKKINKLIDIGQTITELKQLSDKFEGNYKNKKTEIDDLRKKKTNSADDIQERKYAKLLEEKYEAFNEFVKKDVTKMNDRIVNMYNRITAMFRRPVS